MRRYEIADAAALARAVTASLGHLQPWMPWARSEPLSIQRRRGLLATWREQWADADGDRVFGMFLGGEVVGGCGLHRRIGSGALEIGYWVHVDHTGKGLATAAAAFLTTHAFRLPGIERVEIHHDQANLASRRIPEKLSFELIREEPHPIEAPAESGVSCAWMMSKQRWASSGVAR